MRVVHLLRLGGEKEAGGVVRVAQLAGKVDAFGPAFQIGVDESQIRALGRGNPQGLLGRACGFAHLVPCHTEDDLELHADKDLVFDDQDHHRIMPGAIARGW